MDGDAAVVLRKLGEVLIAEGSITAEQLAAAIAEQDISGERLGDILLASRNVSRLDLANAVAEQHADARHPATGRPGHAGLAKGTGHGPNAHPGSTPSSEPDLARKLAQMEARLARLASTSEELGGRLAALEALIPAISEALDNRTG